MNDAAILAAAEAYRRAYEAAQAVRDPREHVQAIEHVSKVAGRLLEVARGDAATSERQG